MFVTDKLVPLPPALVCILNAFVFADVITNVKLPLAETSLLDTLPTVALTLPFI